MMNSRRTKGQGMTLRSGLQRPAVVEDVLPCVRQVRGTSSRTVREPRENDGSKGPKRSFGSDYVLEDGVEKRKSIRLRGSVSTAPRAGSEEEPAVINDPSTEKEYHIDGYAGNDMVSIEEVIHESQGEDSVDRSSCLSAQAKRDRENVSSKLEDFGLVATGMDEDSPLLSVRISCGVNNGSQLVSRSPNTVELVPQVGFERAHIKLIPKLITHTAAVGGSFESTSQRSSISSARSSSSSVSSEFDETLKQGVSFDGEEGIPDRTPQPVEVEIKNVKWDRLDSVRLWTERKANAGKQMHVAVTKMLIDRCRLGCDPTNDVYYLAYATEVENAMNYLRVIA